MAAVTGLAYVLGEEACDYRAAEGFEATDLPRKPDLWGWGAFYKASSSSLDMKIRAAGQALASARIEPREVDGAILCAANPPENGEGPGEAERRFLEAVGLEKAFPLTVTSGGCGAMLAGIAIATSMLGDGPFTHMLVVGGDRSPTGTARFQRYGLFSDAACGCIVSSRSARGFDIVRVAVVSSPESMHAGAPFTSELAARTNARLFAGLGLTASGVTKLFGTNVFLPIAMLKEAEAGFARAQIYLENVKRLGHCYACDAVINLADYQRSAAILPGQYFVLAADAPGLRWSVLLKARGER